MRKPNLREVFENYLGAFVAESVTKQTQLMQSSVTDDVSFSNPGVNGRGLARLLQHIAAFQQRFAGAYFRINWLREQNGQVLAEWTQFNAVSAGVKLTHLAG